MNNVIIMTEKNKESARRSKSTKMMSSSLPLSKKSGKRGGGAETNTYGKDALQVAKGLHRKTEYECCIDQLPDDAPLGACSIDLDNTLKNHDSECQHIAQNSQNSHDANNANDSPIEQQHGGAASKSKRNTSGKKNISKNKSSADKNKRGGNNDKGSTANKSASKTKNDSSSSLSTELAVARNRIAYLEAENGKLLAEKAAMATRMEQVKIDLQKKMLSMQAEIQKRLERGESKSSIMEYVKAGFGTMLGVIAALLVVDLAVSAFSGAADASSASASSNASSNASTNASSAANTSTNDTQMQDSSVDDGSFANANTTGDFGGWSLFDGGKGGDRKDRDRGRDRGSDKGRGRTRTRERAQMRSHSNSRSRSQREANSTKSGRK